MENPYNYRNKAQYPVGIDKNGNPVFGVFANRTHQIIEIEECKIHNKKIEEISKFIFNFFVKKKISIYNEKTNKGLLRHIVIKIGIKTNELMCIIVLNGRKLPYEKEFVEEIITNYPEVKTIVKNINTKNTNVILGNENISIYGDGYITDKLGDYVFKIMPLSFYQVNPIQTEKLYKLAVENANITKEDTVFDLYCGIRNYIIVYVKIRKKSVWY